MKLLLLLEMLVAPQLVSSACCWCGKRYEPLPGYWEGAEGASAADRIEVVFAASRVAVVVPPALHFHNGTRLVVRSANSVVLDEMVYPSSAQHFHSFSLTSLPGQGLEATVWYGDTVVHHAVDGGAPRSLPPIRRGASSTYPFGWFVNYGGWLAKNLGSGSTLLSGLEMGSVNAPVSPFEPGGLEGLEKVMVGAPKRSWIFDLKHVHGDEEVAELVGRFKNHLALRGWYIADEPDGAGDLPGAPLGFQSARSLEQKRALVRSLDPHHPAFVSLNCLRAAPFYAATADVLMVDPYPIGIDLHKGCNATYGVNGCDGCVHGSPLDVAERLATVSHELSRDGGGNRDQRSRHAVPEVWAVLQAFGGEGHWARAPSPNELRASVYVSLVHGASGILLWLREGNTPQPLVQATKRLREELDTFSPWLQRGQRTYTAPLYTFSSAVGRSTAAAAVAPSGSGTRSNSVSVEAAQWLLDEPNGAISTATTAAPTSVASRLTLVVNPHVNKALSFVVPNAWPLGCSALAATPLPKDAEKGEPSNAAETSDASTTTAATASASATHGGGASPAASGSECHVALLFHHGQPSSPHAMASSFSWSVDATTGKLRGFLPPLDTAAFVSTQNADNGACGPGEENDFTVVSQ